jgi:hypothetical protein
MAGDRGCGGETKRRPDWAAFFVGAIFSNSVQTAEGVDQYQDWKRDAEHPQQ